MNLIMSVIRCFGQTNLIRRSLRFRVFKKLAINFKFEVNFYGYRYRGNLNNFVDRSVFFFGAHEREQLEFSKKFIKNNIVLDCGANFGDHSLFYSRFAKTVISIEPNSLALDELKLKIDFNSIQNVICLNYGVGSVNNVQLPFYRATGDNLGISSFVKNFSPHNVEVEKVTLRTVDSILDELKIATIDFIKIDVEGFDYEVLKGAHETITKCFPTIQIEYYPRDLSKITTFLNKYQQYEAKSLTVNHSLFIFNRSKGRLIKFNPDLRGEVFLTANQL